MERRGVRDGELERGRMGSREEGKDSSKERERERERETQRDRERERERERERFVTVPPS